MRKITEKEKQTNKQKPMSSTCKQQGKKKTRKRELFYIETQKTYQLNAMCKPCLDPVLNNVTIKKKIRRPSENLDTDQIIDDSLVIILGVIMIPLYFFEKINLLYCKLFINEILRFRICFIEIHVISLYYSFNFSVC